MAWPTQPSSPASTSLLKRRPGARAACLLGSDREGVFRRSADRPSGCASVERRSRPRRRRVGAARALTSGGSERLPGDGNTCEFLDAALRRSGPLWPVAFRCLCSLFIGLAFWPRCFTAFFVEDDVSWAAITALNLRTRRAAFHYVIIGRELRVRKS